MWRAIDDWLDMKAAGMGERRVWGLGIRDGVGWLAISLEDRKGGEGVRFSLIDTFFLDRKQSRTVDFCFVCCFGDGFGKGYLNRRITFSRNMLLRHSLVSNLISPLSSFRGDFLSLKCLDHGLVLHGAIFQDTTDRLAIYST